MSTVFVHVGQAGCQLAQALWPAFAAERPCSPDIFLPPSGGAASLPRPRAVLVDAEPKAVRAALAAASLPSLGGGGGLNSKTAAFEFDTDAVAFGQSGRGGNFALGYSGGGKGPMPAMAAAEGSPELVVQTLDCVRRQVERCNGAHLGTVVMHSLGGGTGSGLGTRVVEELRDALPDSPVLTVSILPISTGENPMQALNSLLALASLQEVTDGVILYENDRLLAVADRAMSVASSQAAAASLPFGGGASLVSMNDVVSRDLTPLLCPANTSQCLDLGELLSGAWPMSTHRFAQAYSGEVASERGRGVGNVATDLRPAFDALVRSAPRVARCTGAVLAAHAVSRGATVPDVVTARNDLLERLGGVAKWQPFGGELLASPQPMRGAAVRGKVRVSALLNWKHTADVLRSIALRAHQKYEKRAFVHWYDCYGFGSDEFAHAFEALDGVVANYDAS